MNELQTTTPSTIKSLLARMDINQKSRDTYERGLRLFSEYVRENDTTTKADIIRYKQDLLARGLQPSTVNLYLSSIRAAYSELSDITGCHNPAQGVKNARTPKGWRHNHLTEMQAAALLDKASQSPRDYAIITLLLHTGLRTVEAHRANVEDICYLQGRKILRVQGKGRDCKDEFVILNRDACAALDSYLATRPVATGSNTPLFATRDGKRLALRDYGEIVKGYLAMIGLRGREYSAHSLRHTCACLLYRHGARLEEIQQVLRHSSITTTLIYLESIKSEERVSRGTETLLEGVFG